MAAPLAKKDADAAMYGPPTQPLAPIEPDPRSPVSQSIDKNVARANTIGVLFGSLTTLYIHFFWSSGYYFSLAMVIMVILLYFSTVVFNRLGYTNLGRSIPTIAGSVLVTAISVIHGYDTGVSLFLFLLMLIPWFTFAHHERKKLLLNELVISVAYLVCWLYREPLSPDLDLVLVVPYFPLATQMLSFIVAMGLWTWVINDFHGQHDALAAEIEERARAEREAQAARRIAEKASRAKADFAATVSHEIRTPLNGILGIAELLSSTQLSPRQREMATVIQNSGEFLRLIINDILDFSKIDANQMTLDAVPFHLGRIIEESLEPFAPAAAEKQLALCDDLDLMGDIEVVGDSGRLRQIVTNLLSNAIKFTQHGFVELRLRCNVKQGMAHIVVEVEDSGIGIPLDQQDHVFDPFSQVSAGQQRRFGGTGLGLTICRRLARLMGGELVFDSQMDVGSTFRFDVHLPATGVVVPPMDVSGCRVGLLSPYLRRTRALTATLRRMGARPIAATRLTLLPEQPYDVVLVDNTTVHDPVSQTEVAEFLGIDEACVIDLRSKHVGDSDQVIHYPCPRSRLFEAIERARSRRTERKADPAPPGHGSSGFPGVHVLVAEDNPVNQMVIRGFLNHLGVTCDVVADGRAACEVFDPNRHRIVFMDLQMPDVTGSQAAEWIRSHVDLECAIPIVATTAHATTEERATGLADGFDDYLTKPLRKQALLNVLRRYFPEAERASSEALG